MPDSRSAPTLSLDIGRFIRFLGSQLPSEQPVDDGDLERWLEWPPDVFALTTLIFEATGAYRYAVSPPGERRLLHEENWETYVKEQVDGWHGWLDRSRKRLPSSLRDAVKFLRQNSDLPLSALRDIGGGDKAEADRAWKLFEALLELHCLADSASAGYGIPLSPRTVQRQEDVSPRHFMANMLLTTRGTLSRLPPSQVVVLPKMRTPRVGITLRALSHHLTAHRSEVEVIWRSVPWISRDENVLNFLIVPWPYEVSSESFEPVSRSESFGSRGGRFFRYRGPREKFDAEHVVRLLWEAEKRVRRVHAVVLPELALTDQELVDLKEVLAGNFAHKKVPLILGGVRSSDHAEGRLGTNRVVLSSFFAGKWFDLYQHKHHRWKVESSQLQQYGLKGLFPGKDEWWEAIHIPPRQLTFLSPTGWLTLCPLICEDLARLDPVSPLIRGVGPSLLVAVLLDGPQLKSRWSARYASVLAEDPGTSVLTVSSLGMSLRGRVKGVPARKTVAMWKDLGDRWKELDVEEDDHALVLSVRAEMEEESSLDGRSDRGNAAVFRYQGHWPLRVPAERVASPRILRAHYLSPDAVDLEELSRFCHLVDHAIDLAGDPASFACLFALARGAKERPVDNERFQQCRYVAGLWRLIEHELDELYTPRPANRADYDKLLDFLSALLEGARPVDAERSGEERTIAFFERLMKLCAVALATPAQRRASERIEAFETAQKKIENSSGQLRRRVPIFTALAILWAVHRRIVPQPKKPISPEPRKPLDDKRRRVLKQIEQLLDVEYGPILYALDEQV